MWKDIFASQRLFVWLFAFLLFGVMPTGAVLAQVNDVEIAGDEAELRKAMQDMMRRRAQGRIGLPQRLGLNFGNDKNDPDITPIEGVSIAKKSGKLEVASECLPDFLEIKESADSIRLNLPVDLNSAQQFQQAMRSALGSYSGGSSSSGTDFSSETRSSAITARCGKANQKLSLDVVELTGQKRELHANQTDDECQILLTSAAGYLLRLKITPSKLVVTEFDTDFLFNKEFISFGHLQLSESEYYQKRLGPLLKRFGVRPPADVFSPLAQDLARKLLVLSKADLQAFVEGQQSRVASPEYKVRQSAWSDLAEQFEDNRILIAGAVLSPDLPAEFRHQLLGVVEEVDTEFYKTLNFAFLKQDLLSDVAFLGWMLNKEEQASEQDEAVVAKLREKLSLQTDLPVDSPAGEWLKLVDAAPEAFDVSDPKDLTELPMFAVNTEETGVNLAELVPLEVHDGMLAIKRSAWKESFGDGDLQKQYGKLEDLLKESGFPKSWLSPPVAYSLKEDTYPLILFERIEILNSDPRNAFLSRMHRTSSRSDSNQLSKNTGEHQLTLDMGTGRVRLSTSVFDFNWKTQNYGQFSVLDDRGASFCLLAQNLKKDERLLIKSMHNQFLIQSLDGDQVFVGKFESFEQFRKERPKLFASLAEALETSVGIKLPKPDGLAESVEQN